MWSDCNQPCTGKSGTGRRVRAALARLVGDYISGMTDRFALQSHARLVGGSEGSGLGLARPDQ